MTKTSILVSSNADKDQIPLIPQAARQGADLQWGGHSPLPLYHCTQNLCKSAKEAEQETSPTVRSKWFLSPKARSL